jgi:hypothetical protein
MNEAKINTTVVTQKVAVLQTSEDLKNALLIISTTINLFLFTAWLMIQADPSLSLVLLQTT